MCHGLDSKRSEYKLCVFLFLYIYIAYIKIYNTPKILSAIVIYGYLLIILHSPDQKYLSVL